MKISALLFAFISSLSVAHAQDTTVTTKLDSLLLRQQIMLELQRSMLEEMSYVSPLLNKHVGAELNLARLLVSTGQDYLTFSGSFSLFAVTRSAEIAFPFFLRTGKGESKEMFGGEKYEVPLTLFNLDATYRRFLGRHQGGFYVSGGMRYTYIHGIEGTDYFFFGASGDDQESTMHRVGAYFGIGYRYFSHSGFYWGTSLIYGRYFGKARDYQEVLLDDGEVILDLEFLKFGFAF